MTRWCLLGVAAALVALAFGLCAGLCSLVRRYAPRWGFVDRPGGHKGHQGADASGRRRGDLADDRDHSRDWACWRCSQRVGPGFPSRWSVISVGSSTVRASSSGFSLWPA